MRLQLVLLRHGQSASNADDVFTGWTDVPLTDLGRAQAVQAGLLLADEGLLPTSVHTSLLRRAISTAELAVGVLGRNWLPVHRTWRLNERHYGALTGRRKRDVASEVDAATFRAWRRSFATAPPPMPQGSPFDVSTDPRYAGLPPDARPRTESLADVQARLLPYWTDVLVPEVGAGGVPLVVAHGNTLRALVAHLDGLDDRQVTGLDIPTGVPLLYRFDDRMRPRAANYLDPVAAREPIRIGPARVEP
jgi:2,3-bisphosphoglycerate-dependent phosphoglycerate mutase